MRRSCSSTYYIGGVVAMKKGLMIWHTNEFVQSHFSDGQIINQIVQVYEFIYRGSQVYPKGQGSRVHPNGRGSRVYPNGTGSR
jgi:hypothetical protein